MHSAGATISAHENTRKHLSASTRVEDWNFTFRRRRQVQFRLSCMGGLCGACLCAAGHQSLMIGAILGAVGGIIGAFAGYQIRQRLVAALHIKDTFIALLEDLVTIGLTCFFVSR